MARINPLYFFRLDRYTPLDQVEKLLKKHDAVISFGDAETKPRERVAVSLKTAAVPGASFTAAGPTLANAYNKARLKLARAVAAATGTVGKVPSEKPKKKRAKPVPY